MQTCELCGWDTRSNTRVCSSCRRAGADQQEGGAPDATQLLSAVLHAARDDGRPDADGTATSRLTLADTPPERDGSQVVLREVDPDAHDAPAPQHSEHPGTPSIAASLIAALSAPSHPADDAPPRDGAAATEPDDTEPTASTEDHAAADDTDDGTTDEVDGTDTDTADHASADDTDDGDTARHGEAVASEPDDTEPTADTEDHAAADDTDDGTTDEVDDTADDDDTVEIVVATDEPAEGTAGSADDRGDGPRAIDVVRDSEPASPEAADDHPDSDDEPHHAADDHPDSDDEPHHAADDHPDSDDEPEEVAEADDASADPTEPTTPTAEPARASDDGDDEPKTVGERLRAGFQEMGAWAAVAQLGLVLVALLCVFQVVVLLVVHQFLAQVQTRDAAVNLLAAHAKATNIMVPALVGCALVAVAFAAWHARPDADDDSVTVRRWFGMPLRLWSVTAVAATVLGVVLFDASTTIEQARQTTLLAIASCALLGVVALLSPRAIVVTPKERPSSTPGDRRVERDEGERRAA